MYKIYSLVIAPLLFCVITILTGLTVTITSLLGINVLAHHYVPQWWGKLSIKLFLLDVEVKGIEKVDKKQSYIFLANHQGYFDILLLYGYLGCTFKWMMKEYLKKMPVVGWTCMCTHQIFVGDSLASIHNAIDHSRKVLCGGMSMAIFPEGTRTYDGKMIPFKRGAFMLANEIGLPLVPITINGSFNVFGRKAKSVTRGKLTLVIHDPITSEDRQGKNVKTIMQDVHDIIERDLLA